ncbi:MAG TPA: cation:proton antiporter [Aquella sp.]|nr:cation:proton antiporter [Aquella sp.]
MDTQIGLNLFDNVDKLFFTMSVIVTATFIISQLLYKLGKPIVIAGIIAGLIVQHIPLSKTFFDPDSCQAFGMLGIVIFMMLVGSQLNYHGLIKRRVNLLVSTLPLVIPFVIGYLCSIFIVHVHLASEVGKRDQLLFDLFFALAMSMTAFPLLSMFLANNSRINQRIAHLALFCASTSEVLFWVVLGFVLIYFQHSAVLTNFKPIDIVFYLLFIFGVAPRLIRYLVGKITTIRSMLGFVLVGCLFSAALSDLVDLHQVFGGFIFGVLLPRDNVLIQEINRRLSDLITSLLLPAYFFETGMNANLKFIWSYTTIFLILGITIIATISKFGGGIAAGRLMGYNMRESTLLGALLNMRGVFEIMLLNVGLDIGIINNQIYTILIIMTLLTTFSSTVMSPWINKFIKN